MNMREAEAVTASGRATRGQLDEMRALLEAAADEYYNTGEVAMSDETYDLIKDFYESKRGPMAAGVAAPRTTSTEHTYPHLVGTLDKVNTAGELLEWMRSAARSLGKRTVRTLVSLKFDGNSVVLEYRNGKLARAVTRGKEGMGVDVTAALRGSGAAPGAHTKHKEFGVRTEIVMTYADFDRLQEASGGAYNSPRAVVAGMLGRLDSRDFSGYLTAIPIGAAVAGRGRMGRLAQLEMISGGMDFGEHFLDPGEYFLDAGELTPDEAAGAVGEFYDDVEERRYELPFAVDGLVVELVGEEFESVPGTEGRPWNAIAYKFPPAQRETIVVAVEFDFGMSGRLTPVARVEPVEVDGVVIQRISMANRARFDALQPFGPGTRVIIERRGDVIPYIIKMNARENAGVEPTPFPQECPRCGVGLETTESGAFTLCSNPNCPGKLVGRVERFLVKAGIKGIREETLQKLHDAGLILGIPSIFSLNEEEVAAVPGLGRSTARLISSALTSHKWVDYEVLAGAGIEGIGNTLSKALCSRFTLEEIMEQFDERGFTVEVTQVEGFSVDRAGALLEGVAARFDEMAETYNAIEERYGMEKLREKRAAESAGTKRPAGVPAGSLTFVVTGKTSRFQTRGDLQTELERLGHRVTGSVTKNTYALITNDTGSGSEKNRKAVELGVRVMSEDEAIDLFGLVP